MDRRPRLDGRGRARRRRELWVAPKLPIRRLLFLLGFARKAKGWRDEDIGMLQAPNLLVAVAEAFARQATRALAQGLLQGYRSVEEALPVVRGRLREADQLRRRHGLPVPLEVRYDDFTVDIAENQLLRTASERLLRLPGLPNRLRASLLRAVLRLGDVARLVPGHPLPRWQASRLNTRYHVALRLAELVLRGGIRRTGVRDRPRQRLHGRHGPRLRGLRDRGAG